MLKLETKDDIVKYALESWLTEGGNQFSLEVHINSLRNIWLFKHQTEAPEFTDQEIAEIEKQYPNKKASG